MAEVKPLPLETKAPHPVLLEWNDIHYTVKEKKADKSILQGLSGHAAPGSLTVILGSSGSGKTSLLSVLADRLLYSNGARLTGKVSVNREPRPADFRTRCAYVQQLEVFYPYSTVRETVEMAARLRLSAELPKKTKVQRAHEAIHQLGLSKAMDTNVGDGNQVKGISGGEMKRVSIACEIVSSPSLIMLDEPTSGLDSSAALSVVQGLTDLAASGHTVIASIHQPGSAIYALFANVIVLAEGQLAYWGPADKVVEHFSSIGFQCPPLFNPAEYVLQVTSSGTSQEPEIMEANRNKLSQIVEHGAKTVRPPAEHVGHGGFGTAIKHGASYLEQFVLLYQRLFRDFARNKVALIIKFVQAVSTSALMIGLYSNLDGGAVVEITVSNVSALLFFITINGLFGPLFGTIQAFAPEVNILLRERMNNAYSVGPYYLAKLMIAIPGELGPLIAGNTVAYWALKLNHSPEGYLQFLLFTCGMTFASVGLGFMLAAATGGNIQAASAAVGPIALMFLLLGGFYINDSTIPIWIAWLGKVSYVSWSFRGLAINQFNGYTVKAPGFELQDDGSCIPGTDSSFCLEGGKILGNLFNDGVAKTDEEWNGMMWSMFFYIIICVAIFNSLAYLVLLAKGPKYMKLDSERLT
eukprot:CAMPEP_0197626442 /NCGR_PEP_ID=MMETSP1338-20131121/5408_1 /TAXON_ID=43686 ORGANISM="Pelagodinium beii, Strain RCC1491" /NCGR_SAMPLE_ID=MMETSP1338 /ASSEMBLY_ACC=CAM_ASM_000754 /LENGTH=636 /DNA_ID=CAMNT_0043196983 /DNA_START=45 /DNA_END=1955 /DNA_ORIENTATION=+